MQFKHPDFLYALFLLLIPIIVHLFHLRRFKKEAFTNVSFLKKVELQTRRSSQLKRWLTLLARLLALAALVIAFARPFIPHSQDALKEKETIIYLDNSFSMQQKGEQGELLKFAVQQILQNLPEDLNVSVLTNDQEFLNESLGEIRNDLLDINYSAAEADLKTQMLKAQNLFSKRKETSKNFIAISDFQEKNLKDFDEYDSDIQTHFIQLKGNEQINFSIDSLLISSSQTRTSELEVVLSAGQSNSETLPVSLYAEDGKLIAKSSAGFDGDSIAKTVFSLPEESSEISAYVQIEDNSLKFDNTAFFSLQKPEQIKVVVLQENQDKGQFLKRIYHPSEFDLVEVYLHEPDYSLFENANLIILNELENFPAGLENILEEHQNNGGYITIIPSEKSNLEAYNHLMLRINAGSFSDYQQNELKISDISFSHPLFSDVFDGEVKNFQYPKVESHFTFQKPGASSVLIYNNNRDFLSSFENKFIFSAPIHSDNSNFKQSPLVVPTFYNMAKQSFKLPQLYYTIGKENTVMIAADLEKDEVLELRGEQENFIPQQRRYSNKVEMTFKDLPEKAGVYTVFKNEEKISHLSFNYNRSENQLVFEDMSEFSNINLSHDLKAFFKEEINKNQVDHLWKWFVIFALVFLLIEVLLLKYLK